MKAIDEKVLKQQTADKRFSLKQIKSLFPKEELISCGGRFMWYINTKIFVPHENKLLQNSYLMELKTIKNALKRL